jgi:hypothetical protein
MPGVDGPQRPDAGVKLPDLRQRILGVVGLNQREDPTQSHHRGKIR